MDKFLFNDVLIVIIMYVIFIYFIYKTNIQETMLCNVIQTYVKNIEFPFCFV